MPRHPAPYACSSCLAEFSKWNGRCPTCGSWNTVEEVVPVSKGASLGSSDRLSEVMTSTPAVERRYGTGFVELDRTLGGGVLEGSVILLAGEPGIGKSTLALQMADALSQGGLSVVYVSGEETVTQVAHRARRLRCSGEFEVHATRSLEAVTSALSSGSFGLVVVDSLQVMSTPDGASMSSANAARSAVEEVTRLAKSSGTALLLLGQVTKDGTAAGPKAVEHIVDVVVSFEGERDGPLRSLRTLKNRFGNTSDTAFFEMRPAGLFEVSEASRWMGVDREPVAGRIFYPALFGSRVKTVEIQALVSRPTGDTPPRRLAEGLDLSRVNLVLAILDRSTKLQISSCDVILQVTGGLDVSEPSADLAVALALVSSRLDLPLRGGVTAFGELSLLGEVRRAPSHESRIEEARRFGLIAPLFRDPSAENALLLPEVLRLAGLRGRAVAAVG